MKLRSAKKTPAMAPQTRKALKAKGLRAKFREEQAREQQAREEQVREATSLLRDLVGTITTPDQIIKAGHYYDSWRWTEEDGIEKDAWNAHMASEDIDDDWVGMELKFYWMMGETLSSVLTITGDERQDIADIFLDIAERWISLGAVRALGGLEDNVSRKATGASIAGRLKAFMEDYQRQNDFDGWTLEHITNCRWEVAQIWSDFQEKRRLAAAENKQTSSSSASNLADQSTVQASGADANQTEIDGEASRKIFFKKLRAWENARDEVSRARVDCDNAFSEIHAMIEQWGATSGEEMVPDSREIIEEDAYTLGQHLEAHEEALQVVLATEADEKVARKEYDEAKIVFLEE